MILRPYQIEAIDSVRAALGSHRRVFLQSPTGAGKTAIAAWMCRQAAEKGLTSYFAVHRQELVHQTARAFTDVGLSVGYIAAGWPKRPELPVQVCSIQTLSRRLARVAPPQMLVIDEAHHCAAKSWARVLEAWSGVYTVGLTATPRRLDGKGLHPWFGDIVYGPEVEKLIGDGFLSSYRLYAPAVPNLKGVHTRGGDYASDELSAVMDDADLIGDLVRHYKEYASGRKAMLFAITIEHSKHIVESFVAAGVSACHIDGKTPRRERSDLLRRYATGEFDVVSNVGLFGEGFDLASNAGVDCTVECVISARPTQSLSIWLQQVGRALRPKPKPAIILDHSGNSLRHGLPDQSHEWTLEDRVKQQRKPVAPPVKRCPECFHVHPPGPPRCPACGHFYRPEGKEIVHDDGTLVEVVKANGEEEGGFRRREQGAQKDIEQLTALARRRGYKRPRMWASHVLAARARKRDERALQMGFR